MIFDTILFDLDDTLHDRNKSLCNFIDLFIFEYSHALTYDSKLIMKEVFFQIDWQGYRPREEMFTELQSRISWKYKPNLKELVDFWNKEFPKCAEPMANVYKVLDFLIQENVKMGIVTNGHSDFQNRKIDKLDLRKYMKTIIISEEVDVRKPNPEIFHLALSRANSNSKATLFVGDNPQCDIKGAIDVGLSSVWLSNGQGWDINEYMPKYIINNICELMNIATKPFLQKRTLEFLK
ncbi:HAD family hydrolase [Clostridium tunisiense]|uniref:HAD family hydrolase n=1 Tax=Clostridium tunisiense TaxID=219748 RepID=UPI00030D4027|nr:HAD family hydrolase [Clostridium tunisiense]